MVRENRREEGGKGKEEGEVTENIDRPLFLSPLRIDASLAI